MTAATKAPRVGDRQTDERGEWVVVAVAWDGPRPLLSRVRVGSLAHRAFLRPAEHEQGHR